MAFVEKTGKSVEDAVAEALKELNITVEQADVEIIEEGKKGFFGFGRKDAKVRVSVKENQAAEAKTAEKTMGEATADAVKAVREAAATAVNTAAKKADSMKKEAANAADELTKKAAVAKEEAANAAGEFTKKAAAAKDQAVDSAISALESLKSERPAREPRRYAVSDEAVDAAKEFLQKVFNAMKIEVVMEKFISKNDGSVTFKLHGDDMGILIGKHGQTLDSLQYLTNLVANKNSSERVRVIIDVEDYRDRRVETLSRLAVRLADKVKRTGERVALEPMNPHERKIIHMALQGDRRVTTLSEGDDPYRHVVIELKK